jgi:hypothetical protein
MGWVKPRPRPRPPPTWSGSPQPRGRQKSVEPIPAKSVAAVKEYPYIVVAAFRYGSVRGTIRRAS